METTYKEQAKKTMYQQNENINRKIIKGTKQILELKYNN